MVCIGKTIANCSKTPQFLPVICALCTRCARAVPGRPLYVHTCTCVWGCWGGVAFCTTQSFCFTAIIVMGPTCISAIFDVDATQYWGQIGCAKGGQG